MASGDGDPGTDSTARAGPFDDEAYLDAANRLERAMDTQIQILEGIDNKAEHATRLIALLIGIVFSVISLVTQIGRTPLSPPSFAVIGAFGLGVTGLLVAMGTAIITYLSSQYKIGLHDDVGAILSDPSYAIRMPEHLRNVLGTYAFVIGQNRRVNESNIFWFRLTLLFLLYGVLFIALSGFRYVGGFDSPRPRDAVVLAALACVGVGYYILTGTFLPFQEGRELDE